MTPKTFNDRLRRIMKAHKIRNLDIAKGMGKDSQTITNYFSGVNKAPWIDTCKLIYYLQKRIGNFDVNYLFDSGENDLLNKVKSLNAELLEVKQAYNQLAMTNLLLTEKIKKTKNPTLKYKKNLKIKESKKYVL